MDQENTANSNPRQALIDKLKQSKNILVTVSANPSVDQLAACLGLTLWLNKADKHATAVFSGEVPSTLEFLQPDDTLEKNTDSLRDFIISLDKTKADKLRYKVEENVVKIFITPYRTSLSADDLEYSQGDFNVDMVVALGVSDQADLDTAVTSHGRILHDATVATITTNQAASELGSIQWHDPQASSLSELVVELGDAIDQQHLDNQIATALLTGVVAETERFSNAKTTPRTMSISAELMSAGANQQLVASQLSAPEPDPAPTDDISTDQAVDPSGGDETPEEATTDQKTTNDDGALEISHEETEQSEQPPVEAADQPSPEPAETTDEQSGDHETAPDVDEASQHEPAEDNPQWVSEPPENGGTLTANTQPDDVELEPSTDMLSQPAEANGPLLNHDQSEDVGDVDQAVSLPEPAVPQPAAADWLPPQAWMSPTPDDSAAASPTDQPPAFMPTPDETITQIEHEVDSPHIAEEVAIEEAERPDVDSARDEVLKAIDGASSPLPEPVEALNAQPIDLQSSTSDQPTMPPVPSTAFDPTNFGIAPADDTTAMSMPNPTPPSAVDPDLTSPVEQPFTMPLPAALTPPPANPVPPTSAVTDPAAPPPVPPPLPAFAPSGQSQK